MTERFLHFLTLQLLMALHYHHNSFVLKLYSHNCILFSHSSAICSQVISHTSQMRCDAEHVPKQNTCIQILFKCLPFGEEVSHQLISATALCLNQPWFSASCICYLLRCTAVGHLSQTKELNHFQGKPGSLQHCSSTVINSSAFPFPRPVPGQQIHCYASY